MALDWTLDLLFSKDLCQFLDVRREHKMSNNHLRHLQDSARDIGPKTDEPVAVPVVV